ncbi:MAG: phosphoribosylanthranilate isomerase [Pseudomonadota bacterium]
MQSRFDIKICGLTTEETVDAALKAGATMLGFVFVEGSPRHITPEAAAPLAKTVAGRAHTVGLFADSSEAEIRSVLAVTPLDHIQIHGREDAAMRAALTNAFPSVMLAKGISSADDLPDENDPDPYFWLFDAQAPSGADAQGGHGACFDWTILGQYGGNTPFLLAGGLTPHNVGDAIRACRGISGFAGVDVSSGVESSRGIKDPVRIDAFVRNALAARAAL